MTEQELEVVTKAYRAADLYDPGNSFVFHGLADFGPVGGPYVTYAVGVTDPEGIDDDRPYKPATWYIRHGSKDGIDLTKEEIRGLYGMMEVGHSFVPRK